MKTSVRFLSMLLAIVMIAGAALTASATNAEQASHEDALQLLVDLGVIGGYEDGSLRPDNLVERDEMAKIIYVLYTTFIDAGEGTVSFKDVPADNWANGYISWCSAKGIVGGYGNGNFGPDDNVTYDQALKMVCGALGYTDWNPAFWPTDVRTKALRELKLGEGIEGVAGSDKVTRGQVAQIVYNALFADMNETKTEYLYDSFGYVDENNNPVKVKVPVEVAKTLASDVWNFGEINTLILAAGNINSASFAEEESEVGVLGLGEFTLEELGLESYKDNIDDLLFAKVRIFYDAKKADPSALELEDVIALSVETTVEEDVEVTLDKTEEKVLLNGKELSENAMLAVANGDSVTLTSDGLLSYEELVDDEEILDFIKVFTYDIDGDDKIDHVTFGTKSAIEISAVTKNQITYNTFGVNTDINIDPENVITSLKLEEEDVAVVYDYYNNLIVEQIVEPVTASATKYNANKLTLEGVGEVVINERIWANVPVAEVGSSVMLVDEEGNTPKYDYYIYNGKVFGSTATASDSDRLFAILYYINRPSEAVFDEETKSFNSTYTALVSIDGKEQTVKIDPENTIAGLSMVNDSVEILNTYGKKFTDYKYDPETGELILDDKIGKYAHNRYILVEYTVDKDGVYSFDLPEVTVDPENNEEDYVVYGENLTLKYNKATGLYNLLNSEDAVIASRVVIDNKGLLYYSYTKDTTGEYKHLDTYTFETVPENMAEITVTSKLVASVDEETGFTKILVAMIDKDSMETEREDVADFRHDARVLYYCYQDSNEVLASDFKTLNYTYFMRPVYNGANLPEAVNEELSATAGATPASKKYIYAWDPDAKNYVKITNSTKDSLGVDCIGIYTISEVLNNCIFTKEGEYEDGIRIDDKASIWCVNYSSYSSYTTLTVADIESFLEVAEELEKSVQVIIGTHINEEGDKVASVVIVQLMKYAPDGESERTNTSPFSGFRE
ncbi:MAG: S-layer homology domain-containing protein [Clostridia bacterium]|nr:S-layer homology domain-containing protein [Clostridia bacterium]